ncbi:hypothetical protein OEA41_010618 [Lepraria neglecta]|uniref:Uncharacterized protein n=1 Tax=Lepraria neglecta TaxID=209136 RepID=A0AAD9YWZ0_9LECA|nr:hypothetical protein OEA41_010618 [Lepraria neglecta]
MTPKPTRTINIYDKGSNYLLLDSDEIAPLYNCHWNGHSAPHMTVTKHSDPNHIVGTATYYSQKKAGFFATSSKISLRINSHTTPLTKEGGIFSIDKRAYQSVQGSTFYWKGGYVGSGFLKLVDGQGKEWARYLNRMYTGNKMGVFEIMVEPLAEEMLDEIVVGGLAMLSEEKTSMGGVASSIASAGGG